MTTIPNIYPQPLPPVEGGPGCSVFEGCTGSGHLDEAHETELHEVHSVRFDGGIVQASVGGALATTPTFTGWIEFLGSGDMSADEFRAAADVYEDFPAWLRSVADVIDARNEAGR